MAPCCQDAFHHNTNISSYNSLDFKMYLQWQNNIPSTGRQWQECFYKRNPFTENWQDVLGSGVGGACRTVCRLLYVKLHQSLNQHQLRDVYLFVLVPQTKETRPTSGWGLTAVGRLTAEHQQAFNQKLDLWIRIKRNYNSSWWECQMSELNLMAMLSIAVIKSYPKVQVTNEHKY